jgi:hypothetical protein
MAIRPAPAQTYRKLNAAPFLAWWRVSSAYIYEECRASEGSLEL